MRTSERLEALRKGRRAGALKVFTGLLLMFLVLIVMYMIINSNLFVVGSIVIVGNKYVQNKDIYNIADIPERINIFRLSTSRITKRLSSDLRIAEVQVNRRFPAMIVIDIKERQPLAYAVNQFGFVQLDSQGIVMAVCKNIHDANAPLITGVILGNSYVGDKVDSPELKSVLTFLALVDEKTINQLSEINIKVPEKIMLYANNSVQIRFGAGERLVEKAKWLQEILIEINNKKMPVEYIDLSFNELIIKFKK